MYKKGDVNTETVLSGDSDEDVRAFAAGVMIQRNEPSKNWMSLHEIEVPGLDVNAKRSASDAMRSLKMGHVDEAITDQNRRIFDIQNDDGDLTDHLKQLQALQDLRKQVARQEFLEWSG